MVGGVWPAQQNNFGLCIVFVGNRLLLLSLQSLLYELGVAG